MSLSLIKTDIETSNSFSKRYLFPFPVLLHDCIEEIRDILDIGLHRKVKFFSDEIEGDYMYGTLKVCETQKLTFSLRLILDFINDEFSSDYNGVLVNYYENGKSYIERHSDSKNHPDNGVLIISYGATRNFRVYDKKTSRLVKNIPLVSGQVLHMYGDFQKEFEHDIERNKLITDSRFSLSFHKYFAAGLY